MPSTDYLMNRRMSIGGGNEPQEIDNDDWEDDLEDEFVVLEKPNFDKYNKKDALKKEIDSKN